MSKTKNKNKSEVEHLRGIIRKLKAQVRSLSTRNKELERQSHFYEYIADEVIEDVEIKEDICEECGKGILSEIDLVHVIVTTCDLCEFRTTRKKHEKKKSK